MTICSPYLEGNRALIEVIMQASQTNIIDLRLAEQQVERGQY